MKPPDVKAPLLRIIKSVTPTAGAVVEVTYADGETIEANFGPLIEQGRVFASLGDPDYFGKVSVGEGGRYLEWPGGLDFCAE